LKKVALVTNGDHPELTADDNLLVQPLNQLGCEVSACAWDDTSIRWNEFDSIVLRSPWGYYKQLTVFRTWIEKLKTARLNVFNSPDTVLENCDKHYLLELEKRGFSILPSKIIESDEVANLKQILQENNWNDCVFKPVVSASAFLTHKTNLAQAEADQLIFEDALKHSAVLVQPFAADICINGEWSLIFFNGAFSHAVNKMPKSGDFRTQPGHGSTIARAIPPTALEDEAKRLVLDLPQLPLYARVDSLWRDDVMLIMELELIEPALFLGSAPASAERMAKAIQKAI
jgi:glutathione synthase/RimK-type ligase-like ATP-grasp enzyme